MYVKSDERTNGFTIVELIVVIAVIGILLAIATFGFSQYQRKAKMEEQMRTLYADLMESRSKALYEKIPRTVKVQANSYAVYPAPNAAGTPELSRVLNYPVVFSLATDNVFNTQGVLANATAKTICIQEQPNQLSVDAVIITETMVSIGKRTNGAACATANITEK
jgi:prepilin-type N-terminal cleavage/methylation domain-containing protein